MNDLSGHLKWLVAMWSIILLVDAQLTGARFQLSQNKCDKSSSRQRPTKLWLAKPYESKNINVYIKT